MKRLLKWIFGLLLLFIAVIVIWAWTKHEPIPQGKPGPEAEAMAQKMLGALNVEAYQNTRFLEWSYQNGSNSYRWDKQLGICHVKWDEYKVVLNLNDVAKSKATKSNQAMNDEEKKEVVEKALSFFNNDSFWLVAPYKIFDKGTERFIVDLENGKKGLMVTYNSGGSTPGDSYLWLLNDNGFPNAYKMWVSVIPIGGLEASWDDWLVADSGAFLPKTHKLGPIELSLGDVKGYNE